MKIKNQVTFALSIILISISTATAQKPTQQPQENPDAATIQNQPAENKSVFDEIGELVKSLNRKQQIREIVKEEVEKEVEEEIDRSVGEKFERTTGLLDANLSVLNFWLIVSPVLVTIAFVFFRQMVLKEWVSNTKKELEEKLLQKQQEIEEDVVKQLEKQLDSNYQLVKQYIKELEEALSDAQIQKDNILQQLSNLTPSLEKKFDTNNPDLQLKIQQLTRQLEELKAKNPQLFFTVDDYLKQGDALFFENRYEEAIKIYEKVIKRQSDSYLAHASRGRALRRLGRYEEALKSYKKAIDIKPEEDGGWYGKGNALRELQQYDEAIIAYNQSLKLNPTFEWAWYRKARCYLLKSDIDRALENLEKAIQLNPDKMRPIVRNDGDWDAIRNSDKFKEFFV
ncbi:MAG: tetratricopeptide repeat protein [Cyanobacteria bacterium P01_C01_bin.38]